MKCDYLIIKFVIKRLIASDRMNPKNIEQYVLKSVIAYMDLETKLKQENEMLKKRLQFLEDVYALLNKYEERCFKCSIEGCNAIDMSPIIEGLVSGCEYIIECYRCGRNFCDVHCQSIPGRSFSKLCESCYDECFTF